MRRVTVIAKDLDEMIDLVQAWQEGRFDAVRKAIRTPKGTDMEDQQYDNSNQCALWARKDNAKGVYAGGGKNDEFDGENIRVAVLITREVRHSDVSPVGDLLWATDKGAYHTPIFKNDGKLGGRIEGWWVNVFQNEKGPKYRARFKQMEPVGAESSPAGVPHDDSDDIPF